MTDTLTIKTPTPECWGCGERGLYHVTVWDLPGSYCRNCAPAAAAKVRAHQGKLAALAKENEKVMAKYVEHLREVGHHRREVRRIRADLMGPSARKATRGLRWEMMLGSIIFLSGFGYLLFLLSIALGALGISY